MENNYNDNYEVINEVETPVEAPVAQPKKKASVKTLAILAGVAVAAIILVVVLLSIFTNTYKTPLNLQMDLLNEKKASNMQDAGIEILNGLCESEYKDLLKIMKKNDDYKDMMEEQEEYYEEHIENQKDEYGKNYKYSYKIEEKEEIDKDDLKELRDEIKDYAKMLKNIIDETDDFDSDDWEDLADMMGFSSKSEAKKVIDVLEDVYKELKGAKVTKGYELTVTITLKGSELDEPKEEEETICVYKVNGRWVSEEALEVLSSFGDLF